MKDPHTRESRGFGFVTFEEAEDADAAMAALNATTLDDRTISVEKVGRHLMVSSLHLLNLSLLRLFLPAQARRGRARTRGSSHCQTRILLTAP